MICKGMDCNNELVTSREKSRHYCWKCKKKGLKWKCDQCDHIFSTLNGDFPARKRCNGACFKKHRIEYDRMKNERGWKNTNKQHIIIDKIIGMCTIYPRTMQALTKPYNTNRDICLRMFCLLLWC